MLDMIHPSWLLSSFVEEEDEYNPREEDGRLYSLVTYPKFKDKDGKVYNEDEDLPEDVLTALTALNDVNEKPAYDAETVALGELPKDQYMLIPTNWKDDICKTEDVYAGRKKYPLSVVTLAGIYALAKAQCKSSDEDTKIKWAVLRLESFKSGWYDNQKYCARMAAPVDSVVQMAKDLTKIRAFSKDAWGLCAFIPFVLELRFRTVGSSYTSAIQKDFHAKAETLLKSSLIKTDLKYLPGDMLYGTAFNWIGVQRPMQVLTSTNPHFPYIFRMRKTSAPAGAAMVTTAYSVIEAMKQTHWWHDLSERGGYDDSKIEAVSAAIKASPWKYHQLAHVYGVASVAGVEKKALDEAKADVHILAPILQAYIDVMLTDSYMMGAKSLIKMAKSNHYFYNQLKVLFQVAGRRKRQRIFDQVFARQAPKKKKVTELDEEEEQGAALKA